MISKPQISNTEGVAGCSDLAQDATELISGFPGGPLGVVYCVNLIRLMQVLRAKELEVSIRHAPPHCSITPVFYMIWQMPRFTYTQHSATS